MKEPNSYISVVETLSNKYPAYFKNLMHIFSVACNIETGEELKQMRK